MYEVFFSSRFQRELKRLIRKNPQYTEKLRKAVKQLIDDPKHPSLRLHKLSGTEMWSISVTMDIRMIFKIEGDVVLLLRVGTHNEVYD